MKFDPRITYALLLALFLQTAGGLMWAGRAAARLEEVERAVAEGAMTSERLARIEERLIITQEALARVERRLEDQ